MERMDPSEPTIAGSSPDGRSENPTQPARSTGAAPARRMGRFVLSQKLGSGGMGEVWKAWDETLNRWVALKLPKIADGEELARFRREAQVAGGLAHANIAAIHELGEEGGRPYIAMQFVAGQTLKTFPRADRRRVVALIRDAARALAYAHGKGLVHRDVKPENLMVDEAGRLFVMDFGLARQASGASDLSASGMVVGTPSYMSPEQARGEKADGRSDVWGLGATLYELLTDRKPFGEGATYELIVRVIESEPKAPRRIDATLDADLETIVLKCLEKDRAKRYATADALADDLDRWAAGEPIRARPIGAAARLLRVVRRNKAMTAALCAVALVAIAGGTAVVVQGRKGAAALSQKDEERAAAEKRLKQLATLWMDVVQRKQDLRRLSVPADKARPALDASVEAITRFIEANPRIAQGHYLRARGRLAQSRLAEALADVTRAIELAPDFPLARRLRGMVHVARAQELELFAPERIGEISKRAAEDFAVAVAAGEEERWGLATTSEDEVMRTVAEALVLRAANDLAGAERILVDAAAERSSEEYAVALGLLGRDAWLDRAVEWAPGYAWAHLLRGGARHYREEWRGALACYDEAIRLDPNLLVAHLNRCVARAELGDFDGAERDCERALEIDPACASAYMNRGYARHRKGELDAALRDCEEAVRLDPGRARAHNSRGIILQAMGRDDEALRDYETALRLDPALADALGNRGTIRARRNDHRGAVEDYTEALRIRPRAATTLGNRSVSRLRLGEFAGALADAEAAVRFAPEDAGMYVNRAAARSAAGDAAGAMKDCDEAVRREPRQVEAYRTRARLRGDLGQLRGALEDIDRAISLAPGHGGTYASRAVLRRNAGYLKGALEDCEEAIRLDPTCAAGFDNRSVLRRLAGNREGALKDANEAIRLDPTSASALVNRGGVHQDEGRLEQAILDYNEAIRLDATCVAAWCNRGAVRRLQGDVKGAMEDWRKSLAVAPPGWSFRKTVEEWIRMNE
jgi:tetratricopeptide (TPR) repeat protein